MDTNFNTIRLWIQFDHVSLITPWWSLRPNFRGSMVFKMLLARFKVNYYTLFTPNFCLDKQNAMKKASRAHQIAFNKAINTFISHLTEIDWYIMTVLLYRNIIKTHIFCLFSKY